MIGCELGSLSAKVSTMVNNSPVENFKHENK